MPKPNSSQASVLITSNNVVMGGTAEAAAARKTCPKCRTDQTIDQFFHVRGNGRIVVDCLSCRNKKKLYVRILVSYNLLVIL